MFREIPNMAKDQSSEDHKDVSLYSEASLEQPKDQTKDQRSESVNLPQEHHYGLTKQGATCLNNVLLDLGSHITGQKLRNLFKKLKESTCTTEDITKCLKINNVHQQRDAAECLELILQNISPHASEFFRGQLQYTTKCKKDHIINEEINPFWTLPLPLRDPDDKIYSVVNGFNRIFENKSYLGDNMVYCNKCRKKMVVTIKCEMKNSPQILTLLLKRFEFDHETMSHFKSNCSVAVPRTLQTKTQMYELYGIVNHMGSLRSGHYTATILSNEDKTWYEIDDNNVNWVNKQPFVGTETYSSTTAYLLMFRESQANSLAKDQRSDANKLDKAREDAERHNRHVGQCHSDQVEMNTDQKDKDEQREVQITTL